MNNIRILLFWSELQMYYFNKHDLYRAAEIEHFIEEIYKNIDSEKDVNSYEEMGTI